MEEANQQHQQQAARFPFNLPQNINPMELALQAPDYPRSQQQSQQQQMVPPSSSLEDAFQRLLPYHVVADYEAEEDDRILDSDTTGQVLSRSQQSDNLPQNPNPLELQMPYHEALLVYHPDQQQQQMELQMADAWPVYHLQQQQQHPQFSSLEDAFEREKAGRETQEAKLRMLASYPADQLSFTEIPRRTSLVKFFEKRKKLGYDRT